MFDTEFFNGVWAVKNQIFYVMCSIYSCSVEYLEIRKFLVAEISSASECLG